MNLKSLILALIGFCPVAGVLSAQTNPQTPRLIGLVHLNGDRRALFQTTQTGFVRPRYFTLRTGESIDGFEALGIDRMKEVVQARDRTQNLELAFAGAGDSSVPQIKDQTVSCFIRLQNCPVQQVVELYAELIGRSALQHPAVKREFFTLRQATPNKGAAARGLETALAQNEISVMLDGEKFVLIVPTVVAKTISTHAFNIAPKPPKSGEQSLIGRASFQVHDMPASQVAELYAMLVGRKSNPIVGLRTDSFTFKAQTDLTRSEIIHALDTLFAWNNVKIVLADDDTIKAVPLDETTKH